jgi:hypothetical protein
MDVYNATGDLAITPVEDIVSSRPSSLQFGPPTAGVISKRSGDTWTGVNVDDGVGGYFRLVFPGDPDTADSSYVYPRVQGSIGTSGADLNLNSVQFTTDATTTITNFSIQEKTSA